MVKKPKTYTYRIYYEIASWRNRSQDVVADSPEHAVQYFRDHFNWDTILNVERIK